MAEVSTTTYGYIGALVFGILGLILPTYSMDLFLVETSVGLFDALTGLGVMLFFVGLGLAGYAGFLSYSGKESKNFGIIGGVILLFVWFIINSDINDANEIFDIVTRGFGLWCILIAAIISAVSGFIPNKA